MGARRSGTFWAFWELMHKLFEEGKRPPLIVLENVRGLLNGDDFGGLIEAMVALGLQVGAVVMDAKKFVPQSRPRVFIVGVDSRVEVDELFTGIHGESEWFTNRLLRAHDELSDDVLKQWRWWKIPVPKEPVKPVEKLIDREPSGVDWFAEEKTNRLISLMNERHLGKLKELQDDPDRRVGFVYRRTRSGEQRAEIRIDGLAGCLRTPSGGSSRQFVVECDNGQTRARLLSAREAARLMGVPDTFQLPDNYTDGYHAMGDAVAVPVVYWLSRHLLLPLAERANGQIRREGERSSRRHFQSVSEMDVSRRAVSMASHWKCP